MATAALRKLEKNQFEAAGALWELKDEHQKQLKPSAHGWYSE